MNWNTDYKGREFFSYCKTIYKIFSVNYVQNFCVKTVLDQCTTLSGGSNWIGKASLDKEARR